MEPDLDPYFWNQETDWDAIENIQKVSQAVGVSLPLFIMYYMLQYRHNPAALVKKENMK